MGRGWVVAAIVTAGLVGGGRVDAQQRRHHGHGQIRTTVQEDHAHEFVHDVTGVGALAGIGAGATVDQIRINPPEWGTGAAGFGRRVGSNAGQLLVQESVHHGLAALLGRSTQYVRCACRDFGGRVNSAFQQTYLDVGRDGQRAFSVPRVAGVFAGSYATMLWRPGVTVGSAAVTGATGLLFTFGANVVKEYVHWPN